MTECPSCQNHCPPDARFCPKCGQELAATIPATAPPVLNTEPEPIVASPVYTENLAQAAVTKPAAAPARRSHGTLLGVLIGLALVLLVMVAGGVWWFNHLSSPAHPTSTLAAKPAPTPIELAPGLNPTDKTLPAKPATDNGSPKATPAPSSAAQEAEHALPARVEKPAAVLAPAPAPQSEPPANPSSRPVKADPALIEPIKPASKPTPATQAPAPMESTASKPPAAEAPGKPAGSQGSNALHEDIVRRKEALKRQMGVE